MHKDFISTYRATIKAPVKKVWEAIIDPEMVKQYFFDTHQESNWKVGGSITWSGEFEGKPYQDKGVILEFTPYQTLKYSYLSSWNSLPDKPENYLFVENTLREIPEGTELTITQSNYDAEKAQHSSDNWAAIIDGLKKLIE